MGHGLWVMGEGEHRQKARKLEGRINSGLTILKALRTTPYHPLKQVKTDMPAKQMSGYVYKKSPCLVGLGMVFAGD